MAKPADWDTDRRPWLQEPKDRRKTEDRGNRTEENDGQTTDGNGTEQTVNTNY